MDNTKQSPFTSISIGPGIRGIERGVERVTGRIKPLALVEIEAVIIENLATEMEVGLLDAAIIWSNAKTFNPSPFRGLVDFLFAGYPCQPFSTAGRRRGTADPRHLYPYIENTVDVIRPTVCFFENVRGHITIGLRDVISSLERMGYRVHWGIFSAEETGASHKRERVFILAILADSGSIRQRGREHQSKEQQEKCSEELLGSDQLADSFNDGERASTRETESSSKKIEGTQQRQERNEVQRERMRPEFSDDESRKLGNTTESGLPKSRLGRFREFQEEDGEEFYNRPEQSGCDELGDTDNSRLQGRISEERGECANERTSRANGPFAREHVARPGQNQHDWEEPRTIITERSARLLGGYCKKYPESFQNWQVDQVAFDEFTGKIKPEMGVSANGYDFREDFLRALGNSVYADTAELAFGTLIKKHGINL